MEGQTQERERFVDSSQEKELGATVDTPQELAVVGLAVVLL